MAKTKIEEMMDRLPSNIKDTDVLREESKKVLAALLELLLHSQAKQTKVIFVNNSMLRRLSGINSNMILPSVNQLIDYDLISRKCGKPRKEGKKSEASEYTINFNNLTKPLVEKTFDDLFGDFLDNSESLETPINTAITTTTTTTTAIATAIASTNTTSNSITNTNSTKTTIENKELTMEAFQKMCETLLECRTEEELTNTELDLCDTLRKHKLEKSLFNRCSMYLDRKVEEQREFVQAETATVEDLPF